MRKKKDADGGQWMSVVNPLNDEDGGSDASGGSGDDEREETPVVPGKISIFCAALDF